MSWLDHRLGWLFAAMSAAASAGPSAAISWAAAAGMVLLLALCYAEIATMLPASGGIVRYPYLSFGPLYGFVSSWALVLGGATTAGIEALAAVQYSAPSVSRHLGVRLLDDSVEGAPLTAGGLLFAVAIMGSFLVINVSGVRALARLNVPVTAWKLLVPVATFVMLCFAMRGSNFSVGHGFAPYGGAAVFNAVGASGIFFAFQGFREAINFGGECRDPQRDIGFALVVSILIAGSLYLLLQVGFVGAINWSRTGVEVGNWTQLSNSSFASQPLVSVLRGSGLPLLAAYASLLLVDAVVSPTGSGLIYLGDGGRVVQALGSSGVLPDVLGRVSRRGVPLPALLGCFVGGCMFLLPFRGWYQLIGFTSSTATITYLSAGPQVALLRRALPGMARPFRAPCARIVAPAATTVATLALYWSGYDVLTNVVATLFAVLGIYVLMPSARTGLRRGSALVVGGLFLATWSGLQALGPPGIDRLGFVTYWFGCSASVAAMAVYLHAGTPSARRSSIRAFLWLPSLVLVVYWVSYVGPYGPDGQRSPVHFPIDSAAVSLIGVVAHFWAVRSGLSTSHECGSGMLSSGDG